MIALSRYFSPQRDTLWYDIRTPGLLMGCVGRVEGLFGFVLTPESNRATALYGEVAAARWLLRYDEAPITWVRPEHPAEDEPRDAVYVNLRRDALRKLINAAVREGDQEKAARYRFEMVGLRAVYDPLDLEWSRLLMSRCPVKQREIGEDAMGLFSRLQSLGMVRIARERTGGFDRDGVELFQCVYDVATDGWSKLSELEGHQKNL